MATKLKADVLQALDTWKAGKPVRSLELGHVHRMKEVPGFSPAIDDSEHIQRDQERAHAYCFHIIEFFTVEDSRFNKAGQEPIAAWPCDFETFQKYCDSLEEGFRAENEGLTTEELDAAESLAWKALRFGWARAIEGHKDSMYIEVARPKQESKSKK